MKVQDIFNFRRFGKYFASDARTCASNFGLTLVTTALLPPVILYVLTVGFGLLFQGTWDGPGLGIRFGVFVVSMIFIFIGMPVKSYGKVTEKQYGSFWLSLPASRLEKFISMLIMTCIVVPVIGMAGFMAVDSLICSLDASCGNGLLQAALALKKNAVEFINELYNANINLDVHVGPAAYPLKDFPDAIKNLDSPWYYIDDFIGMILPFLFGAVFFKSHKVVKTILLLIAISIVASIGISPFITHLTDMFEGMNDLEDVTLAMNGGFFKKLMVMDTISDTITNVGFLIAIWFRLKTLKH